jgi:hypothetical protein
VPVTTGRVVPQPSATVERAKLDVIQHEADRMIASGK